MKGTIKVLCCAVLASSLSHQVSAQQDCMIGEVKWFAGNFAPRGWAFANGQILAISSNTALFSILGTTYGGDGRTTFGLPSLRGRSIVGAGNGPGLSQVRLGAKMGTETTTLNNTHLPTHAHSAGTLKGEMTINKSAGTTELPEGATLADSQRMASYTAMPTTPETTATTAAGSVGITQGATGNAGGNQAFNIRNPAQALNPIICLFGTFPSRS
ncbi:Uncharacterised protein [BD1-7 clade bacterium]|uniref:Phage tail collar domain-containing protein n=1 Tax=BD1-7 clade bacterium TaxID=2029982 RepID=A0A5S9Q6J7_9GAMM|nr:Uncharacterised protein [BD1-7 clade bacterium]CAA0113062.1 Uncharacterised protein [BD1-7 clade bacterium]